VYGASAITLLTVQSTRGVERVEVLGAELVAEQIDAVLADLDPRVLKIGALGSAAIVRAVAERAVGRTVVVDPVMLATSGAELLAEHARSALVVSLLPQTTLVTPNAVEAGPLTGIEVTSIADARQAALRLLELGAKAALVKGGHLGGELAVDVLALDGTIVELAAPRLDTRAGHGTGCVLASAIAARLALGEPMLDAVRGAKDFVHRALASAPVLGSGRGPLDLFVRPKGFGSLE
jgi:hydroxymethylpyrimidine/phosphomethylpyrimidine kinase